MPEYTVPELVALLTAIQSQYEYLLKVYLQDTIPSIVQDTEAEEEIESAVLYESFFVVEEPDCTVGEDERDCDKMRITLRSWPY